MSTMIVRTRCDRPADKRHTVYPHIGPISLEPAMFGITAVVGAVERWLRKQRYRRARKRGLLKPLDSVGV